MLKNLKKNFSKNSILFLEEIAQLVRVLACHVKCRGFKSRFSRPPKLKKNTLNDLKNVEKFKKKFFKK